MPCRHGHPLSKRRPSASRASLHVGQGGRARTADLLLPRQARYQLCYTLCFVFQSGWQARTWLPPPTREPPGQAMARFAPLVRWGMAGEAGLSLPLAFWRRARDSNSRNAFPRSSAFKAVPLDHSGSSPYSRIRTVSGGTRGIRTPDILLAKQALSQLSYGPKNSWRPPILPGQSSMDCLERGRCRAQPRRLAENGWWLRLGSIQRPSGYEPGALPLSYRAVSGCGAGDRTQLLPLNRRARLTLTGTPQYFVMVPFQTRTRSLERSLVWNGGRGEIRTQPLSG